MDDPSNQNQTAQTETPGPEVLSPRPEDGSAPAGSQPGSGDNGSPQSSPPPKRRRGAYRPSHRATFIGLAAVIAILAVNAAVIGFVLKGQSKSKSLSEGQVAISGDVLSKLGVNRSAVGDVGIELVVNPNAQFNGKVKVGGDVSVAGQLKLSSKLSASDASLAQLEAGKTSLSDLDVNGDATVSNLTLRKDLTVNGNTRLQGTVTVNQLLTVNNNVNVSGNLSVGGILSVNGLSTHSLALDSTLTVGGHIITRGSTPNVGPGGSALGSNGTVGISGNDAAGTISINIGVSAGTGLLANVAFRNQYSSVPHVVITPVGVGGMFYVTRTIGGFSVYTATALPPGGYALDYIVEQ